MPRTLEIRISEKAARQIQAASRWWDENRQAAPDTCRREIERAFLLISSQPAIGAPIENPRVVGLRRVLLHRISYLLYYGLHEGVFADVLALWHTSRGAGPRL